MPAGSIFFLQPTSKSQEPPDQFQHGKYKFRPTKDSYNPFCPDILSTSFLWEAGNFSCKVVLSTYTLWLKSII
jgi:hypothetical protein